MGRNAQRRRRNLEATRNRGVVHPEATYWNGERCEARKVLVTVGDTGEHPRAWYRPFIGQQRKAVEVNYAGHVFYLDDDVYDGDGLAYPEGGGWLKVTEGRGSPRMSHRSLYPVGEVLAR